MYSSVLGFGLGISKNIRINGEFYISYCIRRDKAVDFLSFFAFG